MPIIIEINKNQVNKDEKLQIHFLPAKVHGDGNANVDSYFNNYIRNDDNILSNALRGYPLQGVELNVPENIKALVLQEPQTSNETEERTLRVSGNFDKFTYWNYDKIPSKADAYVQALKWTDLATELAIPVKEEDVLADIELHKNETDSKDNKSS